MSERPRPTSGRPDSLLRTVLFLALVPLPVVLLFPWVLSRPAFEIHAFRPGVFGHVGWIPVVAGAILFARTVREFLRAGSSPAPWDPPARLLVGGPFSWCRNPLFVAVVTILAGEALLYGSTTLALYSVALGAGFHLRVVTFEEPRLRRRYGPAYGEYLRHVPRWPRFR